LRLMAARLKEADWRESDLATRRKSDPVKMALAQRFRRETTMPLHWICARLAMGSCIAVSQRLCEARAKQMLKCEEPAPLS
jgi:hypothetical protein